jgi:hypothetical protein
LRHYYQPGMGYGGKMIRISNRMFRSIVVGTIGFHRSAELVRVLPLLVLGALMLHAAFGATIVTDFYCPANQTTTLCSSNGNSLISGNTGGAVGFTINAGADFNLTDAMFTLFNGANSPGSPIPASDLGVGLYADSGGQPNGSALVTMSLTISTIAGGFGTYTANPDSPFVLLGGTTYWLALNDHNPDAALNWRTVSGATTTSNGATYIGSEQGIMTSKTRVSNGTFVSSTPDLFAIDATRVVVGTIPEPGTVLLVALGLCGVSLFSRAKARFSRR